MEYGNNGGRNFDELRAQCLKSHKLFEDQHFPASNESIYGKQPLSDEQESAEHIEWLRPCELFSDPQFMPSELDCRCVVQGNLGNSGFAAAVSSLVRHPELVDVFVPSGQSFTDNYAGIFVFRVWRFGKWIEVVVDDRLPMRNRCLIFGHANVKDQFFFALLEKAYAKLHGSYTAMVGRTLGEVLQDFTAGFIEYIDLTENKANADEVFKIVALKFRRSPLMGCSIVLSADGQDPQNGLVSGLTYAAIDVRAVTLKNQLCARLIHLRSPWGVYAWKGAWGNYSSDWMQVSDAQKRDMLKSEDDGQFWICIEDFLKYFSQVDLCHVPRDEEAAFKPRGVPNVRVEFGQWRTNENAGGCRNHIDTFHLNPQYLLDVTISTGTTEFIIGLMQREKVQSGKDFDYLSIGFMIYELDERSPDQLNGKLTKQYLATHRSIGKVTYMCCREVAGSFNLRKGKYIIIVSTFSPNEEGDFMLRIWSC